MVKDFILKKIQNYTKRYFKKHPEVKLIVVAGSVGKTSTKRALATLLSERYKVRMHEGNHNTEFAVPLAIMGIDYPEDVHSPIAWLTVFRAAATRVRKPADVDVIIQELGTDNPGDIAEFGKYLTPDLALVTAVTPEHMEFFKTIEAVAKEELSVSEFSKKVLINRDDIEGRFAQFETNENFNTYGTTGAAEYRFELDEFLPGEGYRGRIYALNSDEFEATIRVVGEHSLRPVVGAVAASLQMGLTPANVVSGLDNIVAVPGRMSPLKGMNDITVIDDTYNSSPAAAAAALQTLYSFDFASERIAVLGDMRELGETSKVEHERLGQLCDPGLLSWVVLVGPETMNYTAPAARAKGCQVHIARNAIEAGEFVRSVAQPGSAVLVKGSQNTIFLEETVKLLVELSEHEKLVRQSPAWLETKKKYFDSFQ
jgi:UDP-N-acetylmuramoyl-tripeptide--D-alanyl-D-alanine ligase